MFQLITITANLVAVSMILYCLMNGGFSIQAGSRQIEHWLPILLIISTTFGLSYALSASASKK